MLFHTPEYAVLLGVTLLLYFRMGLRWQNRLLLAASLFFYGYWDPRFLTLLMLSAGVDFAAALRIADARARDDDAARRRWLVLSMSCNLAILGFFKYWNFFVDSAAAALAAVGLQPHVSTLSIVLPVGISFYTFQSMSYTIDVYRGHLEPASDPVEFFLFVSFFPQLVAGPIERATALLPQIQRPRVVTNEHVTAGVTLFAVGLLRKIVIADPAGALADAYFRDPSTYTTVPLAAGLVLYGIQIYNDFAGYSEMARGSASLMGFDLMRNFRHPYFATSISDFWRRWHISLSTWLRDYLYIPLGGNRRGARRTYVNLMTTMLLGGLWHGASWNFVIWGGLHGAYLSVDHWLRGRRPLRVRSSLLGTAVSVVGVYTLVTFTWLFFRSHDIATTSAYLRGLLALSPGSEGAIVPAAALGLLTLAIDVPQAVGGDELVFARWPLVPRAALAAGGVLLLLVSGGLGHVPFIYFQF